MPLDELIRELGKALAQEREALLSGTPAAIHAATEHKLRVAEELDRTSLMPGAARPDPGALQPLVRYNQENAFICDAMLRHLTAAIDRLHQQDPHRSYRPDGSEQGRSAQHALGAA